MPLPARPETRSGRAGSPAVVDDLSESVRTGAATVIQLGELLMILDLHRQGLSISAIARRTGRDPKTIRKYVARGLEPPAYGPRRVGRPGKLAPWPTTGRKIDGSPNRLITGPIPPSGREN